MSERRHELHQGERTVQQRMQSPAELIDVLPRYIEPTMPQQHADFYAGLPYLPMATLDKQGRPWATVLVTQSDDDPKVGISATGQTGLEVLSLNGAYDPFVRALDSCADESPTQTTLFAGVGVDFSNRRRNKLAGTVSSFGMTAKEQLRLVLHSDQHLGNCPKYITTRSLAPYPRVADVVLDQFDAISDPLPESLKALIAKASTVFLATRHVPDSSRSALDNADMGLNHRGGAPGFVRLYEVINETPDEARPNRFLDGPVTTYLVLPDHSGNRFYQSLGNIQTDRLVGLTFPDFATGNMLCITGIAENLFGEEAEALMPRVGLLTRVKITGVVYIEAALQLQMTSAETHSPYNPPVRYLRTELSDLHHVHTPFSTNTQRPRAKLIATKQLTDSVSSFRLELSTPIAAPLPGGFAILDFSKHFASTYRHMDEANPQSVNDDYVRTWTISSTPNFNIAAKRFEPMKRLDVSVKRKYGGVVSNFLHDHQLSTDDAESTALDVQFVGTGGAFSCFSQAVSNEMPTIPPLMLWIAGGTGLTPFMSMWDGILAVNRALAQVTEEDTHHEFLSSDIVLVFAGRDDDLDLLRHFLQRDDMNTNHVHISLLGFQSLSGETDGSNLIKDTLIRDHPDASVLVQEQHIDETGLARIDRLTEREIFLCGPAAFMQHTQSLLESIVDEDLKMHTESYAF